MVDGMVYITLVTTTTYAEFQRSRVLQFTTCGVTGRIGPTDGNCRPQYTPTTDPQGIYLTTINGIQYARIPADGAYTITALVC